MTRSNFRAADRILRIALACMMFGAATPAWAQLGGFGKIIKKAQDINNSKQAQQTKKVVSAFQPMTADQEKDIGRGVAAKIIGHYQLYNDPGVTQYVNLVGATVAAHAPPRQGIEYHFAVLDSDWVNAFSTPGGYIFVTRGALALCDDESELAGVLGHEVAHITGEHIVNIIETDRKKRVGKEVGSDYAQKGPGWLQYVKEVGVNLAVDALFQDGLPATDEFNADKTGVGYAHAAGYPADGLERFLVKMGQVSSQKGNSVMEHTHPPVADRKTAIQNEIT
ncbi:MAG TPA: M48 family metalloprotease, partial [Terriglobia bacterium]|nr:M48 family metalloprotease [Terriglobia bacterium]